MFKKLNTLYLNFLQYNYSVLWSMNHSNYAYYFFFLWINSNVTLKNIRFYFQIWEFQFLEFAFTRFQIMELVNYLKIKQNTFYSYFFRIQHNSINSAHESFLCSVSKFSFDWKSKTHNSKITHILIIKINEIPCTILNNNTYNVLNQSRVLPAKCFLWSNRILANDKKFFFVCSINAHCRIDGFV